MSPLDQDNPTSEWKEAEEEKSKSNRLKWILFGTLTAVLMVSTVVYYFYVYRQTSTKTTEVTDDTQNWETYKNGTYGYSLKYDKTWQLNDSDDADVKFNFKTSGDPTLATEKLYLEVLSSNTSESYDSKMKEKYLIAGKEGRKTTENGKNAIILIADATKYMLLQNDLDEKTFLIAARSFKLISKNPESATSSSSSKDSVSQSILPQTYTNDSYFYLVKYPKEWLDLDMNSSKETFFLDQIGFKPISADSSLFIIKVSNRTLKEEISFYKSNLDGTITTETTNSIISKKGDIETSANFKENKGKVYIISGESIDPKYKLFYSDMYQSFKLL